MVASRDFWPVGPIFHTAGAQISTTVTSDIDAICSFAD